MCVYLCNHESSHPIKSPVWKGKGWGKQKYIKSSASSTNTVFWIPFSPWPFSAFKSYLSAKIFIPNCVARGEQGHWGMEQGRGSEFWWVPALVALFQSIIFLLSSGFFLQFSYFCMCVSICACMFIAVFLDQESAVPHAGSLQLSAMLCCVVCGSARGFKGLNDKIQMEK